MRAFQKGFGRANVAVSSPPRDLGHGAQLAQSRPLGEGAGLHVAMRVVLGAVGRAPLDLRTTRLGVAVLDDVAAARIVLVVEQRAHRASTVSIMPKAAIRIPAAAS